MEMTCVSVGYANTYKHEEELIGYKLGFNVKTPNGKTFCILGVLAIKEYREPSACNEVWINAPSERFSVLVYESWTVHHLMDAITDKVGIPSFQQRLSFNDQPLEFRCLLREALPLSGTQVVELVVDIRSLDEFK